MGSGAHLVEGHMLPRKTHMDSWEGPGAEKWHVGVGVFKMTAADGNGEPTKKTQGFFSKSAMVGYRRVGPTKLQVIQVQILLQSLTKKNDLTFI